MVDDKDKHIVEIFLKTARREIDKGNCFFLNRKILINGNMISSYDALIMINILSLKEMWQHIYNLKIDDCIKVDWDYKPSVGERDFSSEIYVFIKNINKHKVYIKLTINERGILCISFHESK